jgi:uncharacterized CHY-type Zn-finger protein
MDDVSAQWGKHMIEVFISGRRPQGEISTIQGSVRFWRIHGAPGVFDEQMLICGRCQGITTYEEMTAAECRGCQQQLHYEDVMAIKRAMLEQTNMPHCTKCHTVLTQRSTKLTLRCPQCGVQFVPGSLHDAKVFSEAPSGLASLLEMVVTKLKLDCTIKIVRERSKDDVRRLTLDKTGLSQGEREKRLDVVRSTREEAFYPKDRMEKDLGSGAILSERIEAFLRA